MAELEIVVRARDLLTAELKRMGVSLDQLQREAQRVAAGVGSGVQGIGAAAQRAAQVVGPQLLGAFRSLGSGIQSALAPIGNLIRNTITSPITGLIAAISGFTALKSAAEEASEFGKAVAQISAISQGAFGTLDQLKRRINDLAAAQGVQETEAAKGFYTAIKAGAQTAAQAQELLARSIQLTKVSGASTEEVVRLLAVSINNYGDAGLTAAKAADAFAAATARSLATVQDFSSSLGRILPIARELGVDFEELVAVLSRMATATGEPARAIQGLSLILSSLRSSSDSQIEALADLGVDFSRNAIEANGLARTLLDLTEAGRKNKQALDVLFPSSREFLALTAAMSGGGRELARTLDDVRNSAGVLGAQLRARAEEPAVRLSKTFLAAKDAIVETFGATVLAGLDRFVQRIGGFEKARELASLLGKSLGSLFNVVIQGAGDAAQKFVEFIESLGGTEVLAGRINAALQAIGTVGRAAFGILAVEATLIIDLLGKIPRAAAGAIEQLKLFVPELLGIRDASAELDRLTTQFQVIENAVKKLGAQGKGIRPDFALEVDTAALRQQLETLNQQQPIWQRIELPAVLDEQSLRAVLADIERRRARIELAIDPPDAADISGIIDAAALDVKRLVDEAAQGGKDLAAAFSKGAAEFKPPKIDERVLRSALHAVEADSRSLRVEMASLKAATAEVGDPGTLEGYGTLLNLLSGRFGAVAKEADRITEGRGKLREYGTIMGGLAEKLATNQREAARLTGELELFLQQKLDRKTAELEKLRGGFANTASQAELLGIAGTDAANALGRDFNEAPIKRVEREVAQLEAQLRALRDVGQITVAPDVEQVEEAQEILRGVIARFRELEFIGPAAFVAVDAAVRASSELWARNADAILAAGAALEELTRFGGDPLAAFRTGGDLEGEFARRREIIEEIGRLALENDGRISAAEQQLIDDARALTDAYEDQERAAASLAGVREELARAGLVREAAFFGIELDAEDLEEQVLRARDEAQAFADTLATEGLSQEALTLGISIDGKAPQQLQEEIARLRLDAQAFARENPVQAAALQQGIQGLASAIGQVASGARTAKEAFADFARSTIQQLVQVAAQALIVRALLAAVGGPAAPAGAFIASTFGVAGRRGLVVPLAHGGIPVAVPPGPVSSYQPPRSVVALAQGAYLDRIVDRPTLTNARALAGQAVVPLSGGGVQARDGRYLPLGRGRSGELVVKADTGVLFGEAGPEAVMRTLRARDGRVGIQAESGEVLPLRRAPGGRLGVERLQDGGVFHVEHSIQVAIPVTVQGGSRQEAQSIQRDLAGSRRIREAVAAAVQAELERRPSFRAGVRGDKV